MRSYSLTEILPWNSVCYVRYRVYGAAVYWESIVYSDRKVRIRVYSVPDSKVHGANMGPTWVLSAPDGPHVGPMNLAIRGASMWRANIRYYSPWVEARSHIIAIKAAGIFGDGISNSCNRVCLISAAAISICSGVIIRIDHSIQFKSFIDTQKVLPDLWVIVNL